MNRSEFQELHYIAPLENLPSMLDAGILSHNRVAQLPHSSVALEEIQLRRINKQIPGAGWLHDYVNLYFDAHNPMLSRVRDRNDEICVLRLNAGILDLPGVIITDRNAASDFPRFLPPDTGLAELNSERIFARYWTHRDDQFEEWRHKSEKCAEILVPECVPPAHIMGAYVANQTALTQFRRLDLNLTAELKSDMFF